MMVLKYNVGKGTESEISTARYWCQNLQVPMELLPETITVVPRIGTGRFWYRRTIILVLSAYIQNIQGISGK